MSKLSAYFKLFRGAAPVYNLLHQDTLQHNKEAFKKYKFNQFLFQNISSEKFAGKEAGDTPWLDTKEVPADLENKLNAENFTETEKKAVREWRDKGYIIFDRFFTGELADQVNKEIERLLADKESNINDFNKIMFANKQSELIKNITLDPKLHSILSFILGREVIPFQTINFITGSEQRTHSDSIHMTTYPLGYLIAIWVALEDIGPEQGPLSYYPGSHRLDYVLSKDYEKGSSALKIGDDKHYSAYENKIAEVAKASGIQKQVFSAKKGDILIWHANLLHGGEPISTPGTTRKSMVIHYFAKDVIKYHEISERPANL
ncbi:MAG: Phytanoyl-CoA dioxygenase [Bacteroidetes bacterium]|jgi:ectoine hydroxylase-related dioxygenase (phytanoyl-CoA dioxygenase family)|nr:Phytanoyl-CoA dioxygenase [Bacteroidota bacterium]